MISKDPPKVSQAEKAGRDASGKQEAIDAAFKWLTLHALHAPTCERSTNRIMPMEPRSGLCKDYGGRYRTDEEIEALRCTCGLGDVLEALCQATGRRS